ncbi:hypothetical protein CEE37_09705 [candidate division LCP-89 bacterium B3_LCP]|uniref:Guanylate kinase-like domain-containing protein n=1 Tax=candidate division LCP-89 bacterium B3_LCP TaxID=2012998 RepID=A0A532UYI1_UNCL8|nr:MAG: hypothetical protein CEE37_09705 [candidate division LCP-89 bacterium B3_LCP]
MDILKRIKLSINAYVKNDAKASAIVSALTGKDIAEKSLFEIVSKDDLLPGIVPFLDPESCSAFSAAQKDILTSAIYFLTKGRTLFMICGPSASGKDTLASYAKQDLYLKGLNLVYCQKYTTRPRRGYEGQNEQSRNFEPSGNYKYFESIEEMEQSADCALGYSLYDCSYAFSSKHLKSESETARHLACIYGRFENMLEIKRKVLLDYNRIPLTILINADSDILEQRIYRRHLMNNDEQIRRIMEMKLQNKYISRCKDLVVSSFDLLMENGYDSPVSKGAECMTEFIEKRIKWANNAIRTNETKAAL